MFEKAKEEFEASLFMEVFSSPSVTEERLYL